MAQWTSFLESKGQLQQWMESVEQELGMTLPQQPGLKEKSALLERLRAIQADVDAHAAALSRLTDKAVEMHDKTADQTFGPESRAELNAHFADISAVVKVICVLNNVQCLINSSSHFPHLKIKLRPKGKYVIFLTGVFMMVVF